jgi:histidinol dehydrogenase
MNWQPYQAERLAAELERVGPGSMDTEAVRSAVEEVVSAVRSGGDRALADFTQRFDGAAIEGSGFRIPREALEGALADLKADLREVLEGAVESVRDFHRQAKPCDWSAANRDGATVGERFYPIRRAGLYIPGGNVPLVSTVIMTAVPALEAGVPDIAVCTPPDREGRVAPELLAVLALCGVREVYRLGGAQAIAAMAYGTETVAPVDKIFGPGNAYVMEAKRQVYGQVGIDLLPGPSEVMIICDSGAEPAWVAADLLAQAEHGSGKERVFVAVPDQAFATRVEAGIQSQLKKLSHREAIAKVLEKGFLGLICASLEEAAEAANAIAPEHLELQVDEPSARDLMDRIDRAGAFLVGYHTPTALGDFVAGPSHTLPTGGACRFSSGLQLVDFMRRSSVVHYDPAALKTAAPAVQAFASMERLDAHGRSVSIRLGN